MPETKQYFLFTVVGQLRKKYDEAGKEIIAGSQDVEVGEKRPRRRFTADEKAASLEDLDRSWTPPTSGTFDLVSFYVNDLGSTSPSSNNASIDMKGYGPGNVLVSEVYFKTGPEYKLVLTPGFSCISKVGFSYDDAQNVYADFLIDDMTIVRHG